MNLIKGQIIDSVEAEELKANMSTWINQTLIREPIDPHDVARACGEMAKMLNEEFAEAFMEGQFLSESFVRSYIKEAKDMLSEERLKERIRTELGGQAFQRVERTDNDGGCVYEQVLPLGVLLHVAAGNMDVLPAYSVLEGLLTGNINILKMPSDGSELSVRILHALTEQIPEIKEYIYVFDYTSQDVEILKFLADLSDGVVVWGGDEAVKAFRTYARPDTRLIEWGHKLSFAYVTKEGMNKEGLRGIAENICLTNQLLCSSCQEIMIDAEGMDELDQFCRDFLPVLEAARRKYPISGGHAIAGRNAISGKHTAKGSHTIARSHTIAGNHAIAEKNAIADATGTENVPLQAQVTLRMYSERLHSIFTEKKVYQGEGCSITACPDRLPEACVQFGNCLAKAVPADELFTTLRPYKGKLQTVALLCGEGEREHLTNILLRAGAVRVTDGFNMSASYAGLPHDGVYSLQRYTKIVSVRKKATDQPGC